MSSGPKPLLFSSIEGLNTTGQSSSYSLPGGGNDTISAIIARCDRIAEASSSYGINTTGTHWAQSNVNTKKVVYGYHDIGKVGGDGKGGIGRDCIDSGILRSKVTEECIGSDQYISFIEDCLGILTSGGGGLTPVYNYLIQERAVLIDIPVVYPTADADHKWELAMEAPNMDAALVQPDDPAPKMKIYMIGSIGRGALGLVIHLLAANILCTANEATLAAITFLNSSFFGATKATKIVKRMSVDFAEETWSEWMALNRRTQILEWAINVVKRQTVSNIDPNVLIHIGDSAKANKYIELKTFHETVEAIKGYLPGRSYSIKTRMTAADITKYSMGGISVIADSKSYRLTQAGTVAARSGSRSSKPAEGHHRLTKLLKRRIVVTDGSTTSIAVNETATDGDTGGGGGASGADKATANCPVRTSSWDDAEKFSGNVPTNVNTEGVGYGFRSEEGIGSVLGEAAGILTQPGLITGNVKVKARGDGDINVHFAS